MAHLNDSEHSRMLKNSVSFRDGPTELAPGLNRGPGPEPMNTGLSLSFYRQVFMGSGLADDVRAPE
jgi:hypothetical protein